MNNLQKEVSAYLLNDNDSERALQTLIREILKPLSTLQELHNEEKANYEGNVDASCELLLAIVRQLYFDTKNYYGHAELNCEQTIKMKLENIGYNKQSIKKAIGDLGNILQSLMRKEKEIEDVNKNKGILFRVD